MIVQRDQGIALIQISVPTHTCRIPTTKIITKIRIKTIITIHMEAAEAPTEAPTEAMEATEAPMEATEAMAMEVMGVTGVTEATEATEAMVVVGKVVEEEAVGTAGNSEVSNLKNDEQSSTETTSSKTQLTA